MTPTSFNITLTAAQKVKLTAKAIAAGISPEGGTLPTEHGVSLSFSVLGLVATFVVLSKPWYVSVAMIQGGMQEFIEGQSS
jgi:hypothetical protein